jgi:signal peptide peptidase SppA
MTSQVAIAAVSRLNMQPMFAFQQSMSSIMASLQELAKADPEKEHKIAAASRTELVATYGFSRRDESKPFMFAQGVAIIPVHGTLLNRFGASWGYVTGYNFIRAQMNAAEADPDVKGIIFDINSHGGEAAGCFELSAEIASLVKPTLGVVDSNAYSGGYAILSGMKKKVATPSGGVGSVGVITMHVDESKWLEKVGVKITLIYSGAHKADGNPFEELPDAVRKNVQAAVDGRRQEFATLVADNLGMDVKAVMATEAQTYRAQAALELGLIDAVATPAEAVAAFLTELSGSTTTQEKDSMSTQANAQPGAPGAESANTQASKDQIAAAVKAERERVSAIVNCDEAKDKGKLAMHLATNTTLTVEDAKATLAVAPAEVTAAATTTVVEGNPLAAAMAAEAAKGKNPEVGADAVKGQGSNDQDSAGDLIIADFKRASGAK